MSDVFWSSLIGGFFTAITAIILAVLARQKLGKIEKTGEETHKLVNNAMGVQLQMNYDLAAFKAATTNLPEDIAAKKLSKLRLDEHVKKQAQVDAYNSRKEPGREHLPTSMEEVKQEIVKAVETKGDETQEVVNTIPDEVVKKLPPQ